MGETRQKHQTKTRQQHAPPRSEYTPKGGNVLSTNDDHLATADDRLATGREIRKEVLGAAHVERSLANATEFGGPLQELVTEYCWGAIWSRPGLPRQIRSIINIALLSALNRQHELKLHVGGALRNGSTPEEIREVLLQVAVYCGAPAALEASRTAEIALTEYAQQQTTDNGTTP